jgi:hypothetical protein
MHKGEFYTLLPKDAKDIKCTVEVFKNKSARSRSKPRTVSLQGREDDGVLTTAIDNSVKAARYVVPARRPENVACLSREVQILQIGTMQIQIVPQQEVKPTFRTPCKYITVGKIQVKLT